MSELLPRIHPDDYCNEDLPALSQPWWQTLPSDFHAMPDHFLADSDTSWRISSTAAVDTLARTGLACMAGAASLRSPARFEWPSRFVCDSSQEIALVMSTDGRF